MEIQKYKLTLNFWKHLIYFYLMSGLTYYAKSHNYWNLQNDLIRIYFNDRGQIKSELFLLLNSIRHKLT